MIDVTPTGRSLETMAFHAPKSALHRIGAAHAPAA